MKLAKWVYAVAGVSGLAILLPLFFMEERIGREYPPAMSHPEYFYGMLSAAVAWQIGFLVIASAPERYRGMMAATLFEKFLFAAATIVLFLQHRLPPVTLGFGLHDLILGILFVLSYCKTPRATQGSLVR